MALFPRINAVYATYFGTSPPTRACVAVPGPQEAGAWRVKLEGVARISKEAATPDSDSERKALHIQSMSYWAPANIGPYSQSVNVSFRVRISPSRCFLAAIVLTFARADGRADPHCRTDPPHSGISRFTVWSCRNSSKRRSPERLLLPRGTCSPTPHAHRRLLGSQRVGTSRIGARMARTLPVRSDLATSCGGLSRSVDRLRWRRICAIPRCRGSGFAARRSCRMASDVDVARLGR